jgi:Bacterial Ig-like domain (group 3)
LVAGNQPEQKALNVQYIGSGFTPVAPGDAAIGNYTRFKGAYTLELDYAGALVADSSAGLNGTAQTVAPATAVGQHSVAKTTGWSVSVGVSCGVTQKPGPGCSISGGFSYSNSTTTTTTIAERVINARSFFGQNPQKNTEGDHNITYLLSSTSQSTDTGDKVDLPNNDWYRFFHHSTNEQDCFINGGWSKSGGPDGLCTGGEWLDGREDFPTDDNPTVANWPLWATDSALTEGEAGYSMDPSFTGDLMYTATFTAKEGAFAYGHGSFSNRQADDHKLGACDLIPFATCPWYVMHLYTDAFTVSKPITISANDVNFSGMPTCSEALFQQPDVGIWEVWNETNSILYFPTMSSAPFDTSTPTEAFYYASTNPQYALGVAETLLSSGPPAVYGVSPGQRGYVALCSTTSSATEAMRVFYNDPTNTLSGMLEFDGSGNFIPNAKQPRNTVNPAARMITINQPAVVQTVTSTTLSSSLNPSALTEPVSFTATVIPQSGTARPSGQVVFMVGAFHLGTVSLSSSSLCPSAVCATLTTNVLPLGTSSVTAEYEGGVEFAPSTSTPVSQIVNQQTIPTSTSLTSSQNPAALNTPVTFTAAVAPQSNKGALSGTVTFNDGASQLGISNLNAGVATLTTSALTATVHSITAQYEGNTGFAASQSNPIEQTIQSIVTPTVTLTAQPDSATAGQIITFTVTVSSNGGPVPTGSVTISDSANGDNRYGNANLNNGIGVVKNSAISAGTYNLVATYGGDNKYYSGAQSNTVSLTIK